MNLIGDAGYMNYLEELGQQAESVAKETRSRVSMDSVEQYYRACDQWMRYAPSPSRPILSTAWFETGVSVEPCIFLALHGFYEQAVATLRMILEGFLVRIYWDALDAQGERPGRTVEEQLAIAYWPWETGQAARYPSIRKEVFRTLSNRTSFRTYDRKYHLTGVIGRLNSRLNKFVHGRPPGRHHPGATRSSRLSIHYDEAQFQSWFLYFRFVYDLLAILSILMYPSYLEASSETRFIFLKPRVLERIAAACGRSSR